MVWDACGRETLGFCAMTKKLQETSKNPNHGNTSNFGKKKFLGFLKKYLEKFWPEWQPYLHCELVAYDP